MTKEADSDRGNLGLRLRTNNITRLPASRLSGKLSNTSRFVVSSQVWRNTIPTRDCDVLITFPAKTDDKTLMWLLSRLRARTPELVVHVRHHKNTGVYGFYLTASYEHLLHGAEELGIRKRVKSEYGGGMKEFVYEDHEYFENSDNTSLFFTSQERQSIVKNMIFTLRACEGDVLGKITFLEGQGIVAILESKGIITHVLPLHNTDDLADLRKSWVKAVFSYQPLDRICEYFGVKIAMYFAYLGHYTLAVSIPTLLGIIFWCFEGTSQYWDDVAFVLFAFVNVVWATLYLEHWKRRSAELAYKWGTLDKEDELLKEPRPLFHGYLTKSPVTGRLEPHYPAWKRNLFRYFISGPVIIFCLVVVFATMWCIFELQDWVNDRVAKGHFAFFLKFLPKILLAVCIGILDDIYKKIAYWLNDKENYRLDEAYENHLIIKIVLFQFVNSFLSLFYIAFYLQDMNRLKDQLAALLITRQVIGNVKEALVPYILDKVKLIRIGYRMTEGMSEAKLHEEATKIRNKSHEETDDSAKQKAEEEGQENGEVFVQSTRSERRENADGVMEITHSGPQLTQAEVEAAEKKYEDTFEDYLEMLVQFGYVTLFSSAFPLAALCALLNNVIEIRSDAFKLCFSFQRPFGQRVENIGTWQDALEVMSVVAVMVNCALIGMSDLAERLFPGWGATERIVFIVLLEHVILVLKFLVAYAIPDIPHWVAEEKARLEFLRREALKKVESRSSVTSMSPSPTSTKKSFSRQSSFTDDAETSSKQITSTSRIENTEPITEVSKRSGSHTKVAPRSVTRNDAKGEISADVKSNTAVGKLCGHIENKEIESSGSMSTSRQIDARDMESFFGQSPAQSSAKTDERLSSTGNSRGLTCGNVISAQIRSTDPAVSKWQQRTSGVARYDVEPNNSSSRMRSNEKGEGQDTIKPGPDAPAQKQIPSLDTETETKPSTSHSRFRRNIFKKVNQGYKETKIE